MTDIRCDELIIGNEELDTYEENNRYDALNCALDVDYSSNLQNESFQLCLTFYIKIKNEDVETISYHIPYTLIFSLEKYEAYSLDELLKSAVHEVGVDAYGRFTTISTIYFQKKLELDERRKQNHA